MRVPNNLRRLVSTIGPFALAIILLYLAFRGTNTDEFWQILRSADYRWMVPLIAITLFSHWLRAFRWTLFLGALPDQTEKRYSRNTAFGALLVGYMVNYATPRLGEIARSAIISRKEDTPFPSVVGTVVVERIVDVAVLLLAIGSVGFILRSKWNILTDTIINPSVQQLANLPVLLWVIGLGTIVALLIVAIRLARSRSEKLRSIVTGFSSGLMSVFRSEKPLAILVLTIAMWICYLFMALLPFFVLRIADTYSVTLTMAWVIMIIGAFGIAVPSPGGAGSYHYVTILALTSLYGFAQADAATYAFLSHGAQFLLYTIVGFAYFIFFGTGLQLTNPESSDQSSSTSTA